jgi:hypothetical protein
LAYLKILFSAARIRAFLAPSADASRKLKCTPQSATIFYKICRSSPQSFASANSLCYILNGSNLPLRSMNGRGFDKFPKLFTIRPMGLVRADMISALE